MVIKYILYILYILCNKNPRMQPFLFCELLFFVKKIEIENFPEFQRFELMFLMKMNEIIH